MRKILWGIFILTCLSSISFSQSKTISGKTADFPSIAKNHFEGFPGLAQKQVTKTFENNLYDIQGIKFVADTLYLGYANDSIRIIRSYDLEGKLVLELEESWYKAWVYPRRKTYKYDLNGNLLQILGEYKEVTAWRKESDVHYTYDAKDHMLTELSETFSYNVLQRANRNTFTYDSGGNVLTKFNEYWYKNAWVKGEKETYTYDANGKMITFLDERWQSPTNLISKRSTYSYDSRGNLLNSFEQYLSQYKWENGTRVNYTYDDNQNLVLKVSEFANGDSWTVDWKYVYTYDPNGHLLTLTGKFLGVEDIKMTYTYDSNGNLLTYLYQQWADTEWQNESTLIYTYDLHGNTLSGKSYTWNSTQKKWNYSDDDFLEIFANGKSYESIKNRRVLVHWKEVNTTSIKGITNKKDLAIYPNPASDRITINNPGIKSTVSIYDINGQQVMLQQLMGCQIDIHHLVKGYYTVVISNTSGTISSRLIKQ